MSTDKKKIIERGEKIDMLEKDLRTAQQRKNTLKLKLQKVFKLV